MEKIAPTRKKLVTMVFTAAIIGLLIGNVAGHVIWQSLPPSKAEVALQASDALNDEAFRLNRLANERYYDGMSKWLAAADSSQRTN